MEKPNFSPDHSDTRVVSRPTKGLDCILQFLACDLDSLLWVLVGHSRRIPIYRRKSSVNIKPAFCCLSLPLPETIVTWITPFGSHARGAECVVNSCHRSLSQSPPSESRPSILSSRPMGSAVAIVPRRQSLSRSSCSRAI